MHELRKCLPGICNYLYKKKVINTDLSLALFQIKASSATGEKRDQLNDRAYTRG
jgi:hypothetical protein